MMKDKRVVYVSISPNFEGMHKIFHKQLEKIYETRKHRGTS